MPECYTPTAAISLDNMLHNVRQLRSRLPGAAKIIAVVKDNCYGCGMFMISKTLQDRADIDFFAVASTAEAMALRTCGIRGDILVFGKANEADLRYGAVHGLLFSCTGPDDLVRWARYDVPVNFHAEIDTGMRRLGLLPAAVPTLIDAVTGCPRLRLSGVFTHMASADDPGTVTVDTQLADFQSAIAALRERNIDPGCIHVANSATILRFPNCSFTHVRPGIAIYGCKPDPVQDFGADLRPVVSLYGSVVSLREVPPATMVSYGGHYRTTRKTTIATIGIGYAHGVPRYLSNCGQVLIGGKRFTIAGNVTMDYIMADVGPDHTVTIGDEAVIIGKQGNETITPDDIAIVGKTIGYEVLCNIGQNVRHTYLLNGSTVGASDGSSY
jgi:alanine racemase